MGEYNAVAFCAIGAEKAVSNELKKLSPKEKPLYAIADSGFGKVRFRTSLDGLYRALFSLRTADRLLLEMGNFPALDFDSLFEGTAKIPWEVFIPGSMGLVVTKVRSSASLLKAETSIQAIVHKAAAQRLCSHYGVNRLPDNGKQAQLRVFLEKDKASVLLDISGEPLFKRGYRPAGGIAPLRESTAASIILLSGWKRKFPLYDPFCGSGTIIIEAALYAWDQAPGLGRQFTLSGLGIADSRIEKAVREEAMEKIDYSRPICIAGSDADEKAIQLARVNLQRAQALSGFGSPAKVTGIGLTCVPAKNASLAQMFPGGEANPGFIITNPPYGIRLGEVEEAEARYAEMAGLCKTFPGWRLAIICNHKGFESHFGKKADNCRSLKGGAVDTWLYQYDKL